MPRARPSERRAPADPPLELPETSARFAALRARVLASVRAAPSPVRARVRRRAFATAACAFAFPLALVATLVARAAPVRVAETIATAAGTAAVAALVLAGALRRARPGARPSMLGPPRTWLVTVAALAPLADLAWLFAAKLRREPSPARATATCFALLVVFAAAPLAALLQARGAVDPVHPRATGAALGAAAGAWAAAVLDIFCHSGAPWHLALGHALPVAAIALLGAAVGGRALGAR